MTYGHRTGWVGEPLGERVVPLPADLDPLLGVFVVHNGPIDANGLLHAAAVQHGPDVRALGDGVCAGGGSPSWAPGTVGRLTALFTPPRSGEVVVVEPTARRRAAAEALGVEALDPDGADPALVPKTRCGTAGVHLDFRNA
jgi:hypothetical protein